MLACHNLVITLEISVLCVLLCVIFCIGRGGKTVMWPTLLVIYRGKHCLGLGVGHVTNLGTEGLNPTDSGQNPTGHNVC